MPSPWQGTQWCSRALRDDNNRRRRRTKGRGSIARPRNLSEVNECPYVHVAARNCRVLTLGTYFLSASRRRLCARLRTRLLPHSLVRSYTKGKFRKISVDCYFANEKPNKRGDNRRKQFILQDCVVVFSCRIVNANDEMVRGRLLESRNALKYAKPEGNGFSLSLLLLVTIKKTKIRG